MQGKYGSRGTVLKYCSSLNQTAQIVAMLRHYAPQSFIDRGYEWCAKYPNNYRDSCDWASYRRTPNAWAARCMHCIHVKDTVRHFISLSLGCYPAEQLQAMANNVYATKVEKEESGLDRRLQTFRVQTETDKVKRSRNIPRKNNSLSLPIWFCCSWMGELATWMTSWFRCLLHLQLFPTWFFQMTTARVLIHIAASDVQQEQIKVHFSSKKKDVLSFLWKEQDYIAWVLVLVLQHYSR